MNDSPADGDLVAVSAEHAQRGAGAGAWAAAALIVAIGGLGFGVTAHLRAGDLERRLDATQRSINSSGRGAPHGAAPAPGGSTTVVAPVSTTATVGPVDPAGARRGIDAAFTRAYDGSIGAQVRLAAIDDPTGVEAGLRLLYAGAYAPVAASSNATVDGVSFLSATRAMVGYSVQINGGGFTGRSGEARVVGGEWKVTRATFCADLLALSAPCGP